MCHHAKFTVDQSNCCRDMGIFQFLKWQPSASWFSYVHVWTTRGEYLVLFITVQNLDGIDAVVSIICKC